MSWGRALEAVDDWFVVPVLYRGIDYEVTCRATVMETRIRVDLAGIDPLPLAGPWGLPAVPGLQPASR